MIVQVTAGGARLLQPEDTRRLSLSVAKDMNQADLAAAVAPLGTLGDGGHLWIDPEWIRRNSALSQDPRWQAAITEMVAFAQGQGWTQPGTGRIRAHIQRI
jgi:hypothetical protein